MATQPSTATDVIDEAYNSSSDSDFDAPSGVSSGEGASSDEGDVVELVTPAKRRSGVTRKAKQKIVKKGKPFDLELGSGDEGIIAQGKRKIKKYKDKKKSQQSKIKGPESKASDGETPDQVGTDNDDSDGQRIRVRLRSGRGGEVKDSNCKAHIQPLGTQSTADIEAIWTRMNSGPIVSEPLPAPNPSEITSSPAQQGSLTKDRPQSPSTITIPHTYIFAGQTHTSTKLVPSNAPEAQAFLLSQAQSQPADIARTETSAVLHRPLRRKALLEPNPSQQLNGIPLPPRTDLPPSLGGSTIPQTTTLSDIILPRISASTQTALKTASKSKTKRIGVAKVLNMNTVEKSKMDWQAEVARHEGMQEELDRAEKSGANYLARMEFLDRAGEKRDQEEKRIRLAAAAAATTAATSVSG